MTPPRTASLFLVERYLPIADLDELAATVAAAAKACDDQRKTGVTMRYLHSTYVPSDETCFCVFEAESAQDVSALNVDIDFRIDRISPAVSFDTGYNTPTTTHPPFDDNPAKQLP